MNTVNKVNVRVGDTVLILAGNYKGKKGKIIKTMKMILRKLTLLDIMRFLMF